MLQDGKESFKSYTTNLFHQILSLKKMLHNEQCTVFELMLLQNVHCFLNSFGDEASFFIAFIWFWWEVKFS